MDLKLVKLLDKFQVAAEWHGHVQDQGSKEEVISAAKQVMIRRRALEQYVNKHFLPDTF